MRILVVEDDLRISAAVADQLRKQRHVVDVRPDGISAVEFVQTGVYDLVLLDVMLPLLDGLFVCRTLREQNSRVMIMMLTARDAIDDKVAAFDAGADDYLAKPFHLAELSARVNALGRREPANRRSHVLRRGRLELDRKSLKAAYGGRAVPLTPTEFAILEALMRNPEQVFSRDMLLDKVAPFDAETCSDTMRTHIANLRKKIREAGCVPNPIEVLYRNGYRLAELD